MCPVAVRTEGQCSSCSHSSVVLTLGTHKSLRVHETAGEMAQWVSVHFAFAEDLSFVLGPILGCSQLPIIPAPGYLMPSSGL